MKRILVACGNRVATPIAAITEIREKCKDNGVPVSITRYKLLEVGFKTGDFDLLVTTGRFMGGNMNIPVVGIVSLLTGINKDTTLNKLLSYLR